MRDIRWDPPTLSFSAERHGGTVLGSTRAEIQRWTVNVNTGEAEQALAGHRQLYPQEQRMGMTLVADALVPLILGGQDDPRLRWGAKRRRV